MDRVGVWVSAISSGGVIIGLLLLAIELNQNSQVVRFQSGRESASTAVAINLASMEPAIAQVLAKAYDNASILSSEELVIVDSYVVSWMTLFQQDFLEYREGLQSDEWWSIRERNIRWVLSSEWTRNIWGNYTGEEFIPEFHQIVAALVKDTPTQNYYEKIESIKE